MEVDIQSLETFNQLASEGAQQATAMLAQMTGIQAEVEVTKITLMDRADVGEELAGQAFVGIGFDLEGALVGDTTLVFEEACTGPIVEALPGGAAGEEMVESSVKEIGNIMMSGFIDGWANVLETSVDHTPPRVVHDMGRAIIDPLAAQVGQQQEHAFIIESRMQTADLEFGCEIHALPDDAELRQALGDLDVTRKDQTEPDVETIFE